MSIAYQSYCILRDIIQLEKAYRIYKMVKLYIHQLTINGFQEKTRNYSKTKISVLDTVLKMDSNMKKWR